MIFSRLFGSGPETDPEAAARAGTVARARAHFRTQCAVAEAALADLPGAAAFLGDRAQVLTVELPFVWGWLRAHARAGPRGTGSPSQRATEMMAAYLETCHRLHWFTAREEAGRLDAMWNAADPLFDAISRRGEESHADPDDPALADLLRRVLERDPPA